MIEKLKNKYKIISEIGSGGMAKIYKALDLERNQFIAIKVLSPDQKNNYVHRRRFLSEIEITKRVESPYVVRIYDANWDDDLHYIAMELIEGAILKNYIENKTRLTVDETVDFSKQLALGFAEIHKLGIIHRDIKAQNVMVGPHGQIKIIDFGIALTEDSERLTRDHHVVGSVQYMAPELVDEKPATAQSDIYALGVLMFEMLTGDVPFHEKTPVDTLLKHKNSSVPLVNKLYPNVPNSLANIVAKATQKDPKNRYKTMLELYHDLNTSLQNGRIIEPIKIFKKKVPFNLKSFVNSKTFLYLIVAIIITILIITGVVLITELA